MSAPLDLDPIEARALVATPGPWRAGSLSAEGKVWAPYAGALEGPRGERCLLNMNTHFAHDADREFIARSREDVPALIAEVKRLREELTTRDAEYLALAKRMDDRGHELRAAQTEAHAARCECDDINGLANNQRNTIEALERDAAETAEVFARQTRILTGVADALKGPPAPLSTHSHHDLAERAAEVVALLARETAARKSYEEGITWETTCLGCASWVSRCYAETMRAETAEAERDAAMAARERDARHLREWIEAHAPKETAT